MLRFLFLTLVVFISAEAFPDRIVGGSDTTINEFPHVVSIHKEFLEKSYFVGSGSIITPRFVLTAAICLFPGFIKGEFKIRYGSSEYDSGGHVVDVEDAIEPSEYSRSYNIALLYLQDPMVLGEFAQKIPFANDIILEGTMATVTGWGMTSWPHGPFPKTLQKITVPISNLTQCMETYTGGEEYSHFYCTGDLEPGKGMCDFDQGSPLVFEGKLYGMSMAMVRCAKGYPDVFLNVTDFHEWIEETIKEKEGPQIIL